MEISIGKYIIAFALRYVFGNIDRTINCRVLLEIFLGKFRLKNELLKLHADALCATG